MFHEGTHYVVNESGCWVWIRARKGKEARRGGGYGCIRIAGKLWGAHRLAWELVNGAIPEGLQLRHRCHNTLCVNVAHMEPGTNDENQKDSVVAGRRSKRIGIGAAVTIRVATAFGLRQGTLCGIFGLHQSSVSDIATGRSWRHV